MFKKLYLGWRVMATGLSFLLFGMGGLAITLVFYPVIILLTRKGEIRRQRVQLLIHYLFRIYLSILAILHLVKVTTVGAERLRACQGKVIVINHPSLLDVVVLMAIMPKVQCIVKSALWNSRFLGGVMRSADYIRNDSDPDELLVKCCECLDAGNNIILFPEGTRTEPGQPVKFKRGAANIALAAKADIQIVKIDISPVTLTKGVPWYKVAKTRVQIHVTVGNLLDIEPYLLHEMRSLSARNLTRQLESHYVSN